jgi:hypothetical protein
MVKDMSARERIKRYKTEGGASDLVRVEVLVPPHDRDTIIEMAAQMRDTHRNEKLNAELTQLHRQAFENFGTRCLWNMKPSATPSGMSIVADQLRKHGGMDAWRLATKIKEVLGHATR